MNTEQIKALKEAHPQEFAAKRGAGLTEDQAAQVIAAQIAHDAANPPGPIALGKARNLAELAKVRFQQLKTLFNEALEAISEAARLNPGEELPAVPPLIVDSSADIDYQNKIGQITDLASQVSLLKTQLAEALDSSDNDEQGITELREALAKREQDVIDLGAEITLKKERIEQLEDELVNGSQAKNATAQALRITELETRITELKAAPKAKK